MRKQGTRFARWLMGALAMTLVWGTAAIEPAAGVVTATTRPSPVTAAPGPETDRLAGPNRYATAVAVSRRAFPQPMHGTGTVYLARGDILADALSAGTLTDGPILLVPSCGAVPTPVAVEVARLDPARVTALGGRSAVCDDTVETVAAGRPATRLVGSDRYGTARAIADARTAQGPVSVVFLASGADSSPDAVAGGVLTGGPILTVRPGSGPSVEEAQRWVAAHPTVKTVIALGGTTAVPPSVLSSVARGLASERLAGHDRYATAAAIAAYQFDGNAPTVYLARGDLFADAVSAGSLTDGPVLLTPTCRLDEAAVTALTLHAPSHITALGGAGSMCDANLAAAAEAVPAGSGVEVRPGVEVLDADDAKAISAYDPASGVITLAGAPRLGATLVPGDVIASGVSARTPEGLLRKVVAVTPTETGYRIDTALATLPDAIGSTHGPITATGELESVSATGSPGVVAKTTPPAATAGRPSVAADLGSVTFAVDTSLSAGVVGTDLSGEGSIGLDGSVTLGAEAELVVDLGWTGVNRMRAVVTPEVTPAVEVSVSGNVKGSVSTGLGTTTRVWTFYAGIPIVLTEQSSLRLTGEVEFGGRATVSAERTASFAAGLDYHDGEFELVAEPHVSSSGPVLDAEADLAAELGLGPEETVKFYGVAGMTTGVHAYLRGAVAFPTGSPPTCTLGTGLEAEVGVLAGIEFSGVRLSPDWKVSATAGLPGPEWSGPCAAAFPTWTGTGTPSTPLTVTTDGLPLGLVGSQYSATLTATGGVPPYTWAVGSGSWPAGLSLDPGSGTVGGTPTAAGDADLMVRVTDSLERQATAGVSLSIVDPSAEGALDPGPVLLRPATVEVPYREYLPGDIGGDDVTWDDPTTSLPPGLRVEEVVVQKTSIVVVSGTPTRAGSFAVALRATDESGGHGYVVHTLVVSPQPQEAALEYLGADAPSELYPYGFSVTSGSHLVRTETSTGLRTDLTETIGRPDMCASSMRIENSLSSGEAVAVSCYGGADNYPDIVVYSVASGTYAVLPRGLDEQVYDVSLSSDPHLVGYIIAKREYAWSSPYSFDVYAFDPFLGRREKVVSTSLTPDVLAAPDGSHLRVARHRYPTSETVITVYRSPFRTAIGCSDQLADTSWTNASVWVMSEDDSLTRGVVAYSAYTADLKARSLRLMYVDTCAHTSVELGRYEVQNSAPSDYLEVGAHITRDGGTMFWSEPDAPGLCTMTRRPIRSDGSVGVGPEVGSPDPGLPPTGCTVAVADGFVRSTHSNLAPVGDLDIADGSFWSGGYFRLPS